MTGIWIAIICVVGLLFIDLFIWALCAVVSSADRHIELDDESRKQ